jgi:hypothetical protein
METENKVYVVDVSNPRCWNGILADYKSQTLKILDSMRPLFKDYIGYANLGLSAYRLLGGVIMYEREIQEIAKFLEISFIECLMFQLTYEFFSACTTAILRSDGEYVCVRTMDWELDLLKGITVRVRVENEGKYLFDAITWAGFVGIFTGIKRNEYSIALNYRRSETPNFISNLTSLTKGHFPNAFLIRDILSSDNAKSAFDRIQRSRLIAPAYYSFMSKDVKCRIIREREEFKIVYAPCTQTNCDDYLEGKAQNKIEPNIMYSHERLSHMEGVIKSNLPLKDLIEHINKFPVKNEHTIYTVIMTLEKFIYIKIH